MKIAFLVLAHGYPQQLKSLISSLDDPRFDIYLHIDGKSDIAQFELDKYELKQSNLTLVPRHKVYWADISMVETMLELYGAAYKHGGYDRYVLLSGEDYPLRSNDAICEFLSKDVEFLRAVPMFSKMHVTDYWFWKLPSKFLVRAIRKGLSLLGIRKKPYLTVGGKRWDVFFSSQWQALSEAAVGYILETVEKHPEIMRYFRYARASDEIVIATVLSNCEDFSSRLYPESEGDSFSSRPVLHYLNLQRSKDSSVQIYNEQSFESAMASGKLFIRKLRDGQSDALRAMIDEARK